MRSEDIGSMWYQSGKQTEHAMKLEPSDQDEDDGIMSLPYMGVSENSGTPKSSILIGPRVFHYFHHPFWGTPIFGNTHMEDQGFSPMLSVKYWTEARCDPVLCLANRIFGAPEINKRTSHLRESWSCSNHCEYRLHHFVDIHIFSIGSCLEAWFDGFWPHKSVIWHGTRKCIDRWFKVQTKPNSGFLERLSNS